MTSKRLLLENARRSLEDQIRNHYKGLESLVLDEDVEDFTEALNEHLEIIAQDITKMIVLERFLNG